MVLFMEKGSNIIQMEKLDMMVNILQEKGEVTENIFGRMEHIIQANEKMVYVMEKENYIIQMEISNMKVIMIMINMKALGNIIGKMDNTMLANGKTV